MFLYDFLDQRLKRKGVPVGIGGYRVQAAAVKLSIDPREVLDRKKLESRRRRMMNRP